MTSRRTSTRRIGAMRAVSRGLFPLREAVHRVKKESGEEEKEVNNSTRSKKRSKRGATGGEDVQRPFASFPVQYESTSNAPSASSCATASQISSVFSCADIVLGSARGAALILRGLRETLNGLASRMEVGEGAVGGRAAPSPLPLLQFTQSRSACSRGPPSFVRGRLAPRQTPRATRAIPSSPPTAQRGRRIVTQQFSRGGRWETRAGWDEHRGRP
jgi:hypothetical protein